MQGLISNVRRHSPAEQAGILPGEKLCRVNGVSVKDIIELSFQASDNELDLELENTYGRRRSVHISKDPDEDLGLEFAAAVFDKVRTCCNKCIFCFVEQMIPGLRSGLYVRDDDYRLSFLYGNFITLTNMSEADYQRIAATHLTPLYVSVHATDPAVRSCMMNNPRAGEIMLQLQRLLATGANIHTQIVCCPGYNNGAVLKRTFQDLYSLYPGVLTMAVVPVGLTRYRETLPQLRGFTTEEATALVEEVSKWQRLCRRKTGKSFIYLADEFYLMAGRTVPQANYYDGFPQLENGVGLTRKFIDEWQRALAKFPKALPREPALLPVGTSAYRVLLPLLQYLNSKYGTKHKLLAVANRFFGGEVNVTGLLAGCDLLSSSIAERHYHRIVLPAIVLNSDFLFLDDMNLQAFQSAYPGSVETAADAATLLSLLLEAH